MKWYLQVLKKYAVFSGRARRTEYWMFALFNIIFSFAAIIIDMAAGTTYYNLPYGIFYFLYTLAVLVPGLAVTVRRLHDVGKSGWMILIALIPIIGVIWLFVLMVQDSEPGKNDYGENPKKGQEENFIADQKTSSNGASKPVPCRGWVEKIEPSKVPAMFPASLTVQPLSDGISISLGNVHSGPTNPRDMFGGALEIGLFHTLSGRGSNEPVLLPYDCVEKIKGEVISKKKEGNVTRLEAVETISECRMKPLPKDRLFRFDITYRPPVCQESKIVLTLVADRSVSTEDPQLTLTLFNDIASAIAQQHAVSGPTTAFT